MLSPLPTSNPRWRIVDVLNGGASLVAIGAVIFALAQFYSRFEALEKQAGKYEAKFEVLEKQAGKHDTRLDELEKYRKAWPEPGQIVPINALCEYSDYQRAPSPNDKTVREGPELKFMMLKCPPNR